MSKRSWLLVILFPLVLAGWMPRHTVSSTKILFHASQYTPADRYAALAPTPAAQQPPAETPTPRVLPEVGTNAGLVIGASILVLIIIGGVIFNSRKKGKG